MKDMRLIFLIALMLTTAGCTVMLENNETFNQQTDISLVWKGEEQIKYEPESFQYSVNDTKNTYRVYNDRLSLWFVLECSERPATEGQEITAALSWTGESRNKTFDKIQMTVTKTDENGMVWLWSQANRIGIVIKNI